MVVKDEKPKNKKILWLIAPGFSPEKNGESAEGIRHRALYSALKKDRTLIVEVVSEESGCMPMQIAQKKIQINPPQYLIGSHHTGNNGLRKLMQHWKKKAQKPLCVIDINGSPLYEGMTQSEGKPWYEGSYRAYKGKRMMWKWCEYADAALVATPSLAEEMREQYGLKIFLFRPLPTEEKIQAGARENDSPPYLLWTGGLNSWTSADDLYECIRRTLESDQELQWYITGEILYGVEEEALPNLKRKTESLPEGLRARVHFPGRVPGKRFEDLLTGCIAGVCIDRPSWDTKYGARNRVFDFLERGKPVIMTRGSDTATILDPYLQTLMDYGDWERLPSIVQGIQENSRAHEASAQEALKALLKMKEERDKGLLTLLKEGKIKKEKKSDMSPSWDEALMAVLAFPLSLTRRLLMRLFLR